MKKVMFIIVFVFLFSCQKEKTNHFVGNWYFDAIVDYDSTKVKYPKFILESEFAPFYNFEILNDSLIDYKQGFYYSISNKVWQAKEGYEFLRSYYFLGTKTKYKTEKSNILYFNKSSKDWDTIKVKKISSDTMIIQGYENAFYRLIKKQNNYYNNIDYDAITVERSPCFGSCPFNSTYIDRKGNFFFKGYDSNTQNNNLKSILNNEMIKYYFDQFDKIPILKLKDSYSILATDSQTNTVSFFKKGKIVKTINCYIKSPIDLKKAYSELSFAYQNVKVEYDNQFLFGKKVSFYSFNSNGSVFRIKDAEDFFLEVALRNGKEVNIRINPKYSLEFNDWDKETNVIEITTDGRYYQILMKDKTKKIIDIGFNFIENNPIIKKNREN